MQIKKPRKQRVPARPPKALILAAGRGERMASQGPKPLVSFLGQPLLLRALKTLRAAGISEAIVVVGHQGDVVAEAARRHAATAGMAVHIVRARDWQRGNGASALAAKDCLQEPFLMVMCDHLFDPELLGALMRARAPQDGLLLAVDRRLDNPLVDPADVTRVKLDGERIVAIGKQLEDADGWDTGAFFCTPAVFDALAASDGSVTDAVRRLAADGKAKAFDIGDRFWMDLDDAQALQRARRELLRRVAAKAHDGPVARLLNRPLSRIFSAWFADHGVTPMQITWGAFALALMGALLMAAPFAWTLVVGGLLAQLASIIDGCDGEVARLTLNESETGGWIDAVLDRYGDAAMLSALMLHALWHGHAEVAAAALAGVAALSGALINSYTADKYDGWMRRMGKIHRFRLGRDVRIFALMVAALLDAPMWLLWGLALVMHVENTRRILVIARSERPA